jgi:hypothetical protein
LPGVDVEVEVAHAENRADAIGELTQRVVRARSERVARRDTETLESGA